MGTFYVINSINKVIFTYTYSTYSTILICLENASHSRIDACTANIDKTWCVSLYRTLIWKKVPLQLFAWSWTLFTRTWMNLSWSVGSTGVYAVPGTVGCNNCRYYTIHYKIKCTCTPSPDTPAVMANVSVVAAWSVRAWCGVYIYSRQLLQATVRGSR